MRENVLEQKPYIKDYKLWEENSAGILIIAAVQETGFVQPFKINGSAPQKYFVHQLVIQTGTTARIHILAKFLFQNLE